MLLISRLAHSDSSDSCFSNLFNQNPFFLNLRRLQNLRMMNALSLRVCGEKRVTYFFIYVTSAFCSLWVFSSKREVYLSIFIRERKNTFKMFVDKESRFTFASSEMRHCLFGNN